MSILGNLGGFMGGITDEAAKIRQERETKEQNNLKLTMSMLQNIMENPQITNPQLKEEALNASRDVLMTHLFPGQFKAKPGKLHKLVEEFVGQASGDGGADALAGLGRGEGAGRGNAKSSVGGIAPPPDQGMQQGGQPMPPPLPDGGVSDMLGHMAQPPAPMGGPPPMPVGLNAGFQSPAQQQQAQLDFMQKSQDIQDTSKQKNEMITADFDLGPIKKGSKFDARLVPAIDTYIRSQVPDIVTVESTTPEGHKIVHFLNKNTMTEVSSKDLGEVMEAVRGLPTEAVKAFQRKNGRLPNQDEIMDMYKEFTQAGAQIHIDVNQAALGANDEDTMAGYAHNLAIGKPITEIPPTVRKSVFKYMSENDIKIPDTMLSPPAQKTLADTDSALDLIYRIQAEVQPHKNDNTPLGTAFDAMLYKMGIQTDKSGLIAAESINQVASGARLVGGSSRAIQALLLAMQHTPNPNKDTWKMQWDKLQQAETRLKEVRAATYMYGNKYGVAPSESDVKQNDKAVEKWEIDPVTGELGPAKPKAK